MDGCIMHVRMYIVYPSVHVYIYIYVYILMSCLYGSVRV